MSVTISPPMFLQFLDPNNSGSPLVGGQLFTYVAGTSTKQTTWTDSTQGTPNSNPIVLDPNGACYVWLDPTLSYKFVLAPKNDTDPPASPYRTVDDIEGPVTNSTFSSFVTASMIGAVLWPQTAAELAAGVTPQKYYYEPYDLRRYGADPGGVSASDAALVSAIAVCGTTGGRIRAPAGTYTFSNQLSADYKIAIIIEGDAAITGGSLPATVFKYTGTTSPWMIWDSGKGIQFRNVYVTATSMVSGTYARFNNDGTHGDPSQCAFLDCVFDDPGLTNTFLDLNKSIEWTLERVAFYGGLRAMRLAASGGYLNSFSARGCNFGGSAQAPIQGSVTSGSFDKLTFEPLSNGTAGAFAGDGTTYFGLNGSIRDVWCGDVSSTTPSTWLAIASTGGRIVGGTINGNQAGTTAIAFGASNGATVNGVQFNALLNAIDFAASPCRGVVSKGNVASATVTNPYANTSNVPLGQFDFSIGFNFGIPSGHGALTPNGFKVNQDGSIEVWGHATGLVAGNNTINFSGSGLTAFPNALLNATANYDVVHNVGATLTIPASGFAVGSFVINLNDSGATADAVYWRAEGW